MKVSNLELAAAVYWGDFMDSDDCNLKAQNCPETQFLFLETLRNLSDEAKLLVRTILSMPDSAYYNNGRIIMYEVYSYMERRYKWTKKKIKKVCAELNRSLGASHESKS